VEKESAEAKTLAAKAEWCASAKGGAEAAVASARRRSREPLKPSTPPRPLKQVSVAASPVSVMAIVEKAEADKTRSAVLPPTHAPPPRVALWERLAAEPEQEVPNVDRSCSCSTDDEPRDLAGAAAPASSGPACRASPEAPSAHLLRARQQARPMATPPLVQPSAHPPQSPRTQLVPGLVGFGDIVLNKVHREGVASTPPPLSGLSSHAAQRQRALMAHLDSRLRTSLDADPPAGLPGYVSLDTAPDAGCRTPDVDLSRGISVAADTDSDSDSDADLCTDTPEPLGRGGRRSEGRSEGKGEGPLPQRLPAACPVPHAERRQEAVDAYLASRAVQRVDFSSNSEAGRLASTQADEATAAVQAAARSALARQRWRAVRHAAKAIQSFERGRATRAELQEEARIQWIAYHVAHRQYSKARDLGWDGEHVLGGGGDGVVEEDEKCIVQ